ncbi:hypothetical protein [Nocardia sp. NPDC051463]|uniref:hypothetical protein n=1 Tax=Nocardia sp. NPDC051463 TaxID=3154845 RepID=UPI00344D6B17
MGAVAPFARPLSSRVRALDADVRRLTRQHDVTLIDFEPVAVTTHPKVWAEDRLHLSPLGHDLVARAVAATLGVSGADETWRQPLPPIHRTATGMVAGEARWAADHLLPWMVRRLRGRSSGTDIQPKRPTLLPVPI